MTHSTEGQEFFLINQNKDWPNFTFLKPESSFFSQTNGVLGEISTYEKPITTKEQNLISPHKI